MYEQKIQFNYPKLYLYILFIYLYFDRSGITKFFGSRKEKDKTPPPTSLTPSSTGTATPTSTTAASPTHSNDSGDKIKENGSKEGGEEKGDGETGTVDIKKASEIVSDEVSPLYFNVHTCTHVLIDLWFILLLLF